MTTRLNSLLIFSLLALSLLTTTPLLAQEAEEPQRAVLITGATTGIGRVTAEHLASNGFFVYAGARKRSDMDELNAIENVMAVRIDVTKQDQIDAAVETIRNEGRGLYGLINNAGVSVSGPLIELPVEEFLFQMDVNVTGVYRVTQAFAPMIIESQGRISVTGSIAGYLTWPYGAPYSMSKHAMESYAETLATELEQFGVAVSIVEPGSYNSDITKSRLDRIKDSGLDPEGSLYKEDMERMMSASGDRSSLKDPIEVAEAFYEFLTSEEPRLRYLVVPDVNQARFTILGQLMRAVQTNDSQAYTFTREELIEILDQVIEMQNAAGQN
jgi:NAD(P)-dependent dehydrogenase (short-subunit alcohol dehydrogenase family)